MVAVCVIVASATDQTPELSIATLPVGSVEIQWTNPPAGVLRGVGTVGADVLSRGTLAVPCLGSLA